MTRRARHPAKTLLLLLAFGVAAWAVVENWPSVRDSLRAEEHKPDAALVQRLRAEVEKLLESDPCARGVQDVAWRVNEGRFVVRLDSDPSCGQGAAKELCARVAHMVKARGGKGASVFAYNGAGDQLAQYIE